ncbi:hypothetical protein ABTM49_19895, partial [Acinetobacter baumannii]
LHTAVLKEIARAIEHRTVMHQYIASADGWDNRSEALKKRKSELERQLKLSERKIENLINAIANGGPVQRCTEAVSQLEQTQAEIKREI